MEIIDPVSILVLGTYYSVWFNLLFKRSMALKYKVGLEIIP